MFFVLLDFHAVFQQQSSYQASSIHSRRRLSFMSASRVRHLPSKSPTPPPPPVATTQRPPSTSPTPMAAVDHQDNDHSIGRNRLLSDLWLMLSATFRRLGKIEQAKGAIHEAEVKDVRNRTGETENELSLGCIISLWGCINMRWILFKKLCL